MGVNELLPASPKAPATFQTAHPAEAELRDFSYIVSHDLAACFRHIEAFTFLLIQDVGDGASEAQRSHSEHIRRETERCSAMMDQLLAFSRVQTRDLALAPYDGTRLMETALLQLSAEAHAVGAEVSIEPLGEQLADSDLLTMAFKAGLSNAIKFRRPDTPPRIEVRGLETPDAWIVQIIDDGIGVPLERQDKLFRMFYQDHPAGRYPGIGAGLTICRRIIRRHGGDVCFVPSDGATCLQITLPPVEAAALRKARMQ